MTKTRTFGFTALLVLSTVLVSFSGPAAAAPPSGWTAPFQVENAATYSHEPEGVQLAMAGGGRALAAWTQYAADFGFNVVMWSMYLPGSGWSSPVAIMGTSTEARAPAVAGYANGSFELIYRDYEIWTGAHLVDRHWQPDTGWKFTGQIPSDPTATDVDYPRVAVDGQGNAIATWLSNNGTHWDLRANRWTPSGGWGLVNASLETSDLTAQTDHQLTVDAAGDALAAWRQSDGGALSLYANRYIVGSGWGTATLVESSAQSVYSPVVAEDASGNAMALWQQFNGTRDAVFYNHFVVGTGWGTATQLSNAGSGGSYYPAVTATTGSGFAAAWTQGNGGGSRQYPFAVTFDGSAWSSPMNMSGGADLNTYAMVASSDAAGRVLFVWRTQMVDGLDQVWSAWWVPGHGLEAVGGRLDASADSVGSLLVDVAPAGEATVFWQQPSGVTWHLFGAMDATPDTAPPALEASIYDGATTQNASTVVEGTAEVGSTVTVNGVAVLVDGAGNFEVRVPLAPGANTIDVMALDAAGNPSHQTFDITYADPVPGLQSQLSTTQGQLASAQSSLATTQGQLATTQADLAAAKAALNTTQTTTAASDADLAAKVSNASGSAGTAMLVGLLGLIVGLAGIAMGFMMSRKKPSAVSLSAVPPFQPPPPPPPMPPAQPPKAP